jgi:hypothetical protein
MYFSFYCIPHSAGFSFVLGMLVGMKFLIDIRDVHIDIPLFYGFMVLDLSDPEQTIV